jgi:N-acetyl-anhydromuramyl-L-alanine amidase AmpD
VLLKEFKIPRHRVLAHGEVKQLTVLNEERTELINEKAPCPGYEFDWPALERRGLAARPSSSAPGKRSYEAFFDEFPKEVLDHGNDDKGSKYGLGSQPRPRYRRLIEQLQEDLHAIGYEAFSFNELGAYNGRTFRVVERFQARYCTAGRKLAGEPGKLDRVTAIRIREVLHDQSQP